MSRLLIIYNNVYDVSAYFNANNNFLGENVQNLFTNFYGRVIFLYSTTLFFNLILKLYYRTQLINGNSLNKEKVPQMLPSI
jgi:hypothetical protein